MHILWAKAIEKIALLAGNPSAAGDFLARARDIKRQMLRLLWSNDNQFFMEKVKEDGSWAPACEIIGFAPWYFNIPDDNTTYIAAWNKIDDSTGGFNGEYGIRTTEKSSSYYLSDYLPNTCQWNGPSWPFTSAITLTAMANILNDYTNKGIVTKDLYYGELKKYALQQYKNGQPYVAESFHPDSNIWTCDIAQRSENYLHSTYNDLIISGLVGIRSSSEDQLIVNPQIPVTWDHFCLEDLTYHGSSITVVYDVRNAGKRYGLNGVTEVDRGLSIYVNGIRKGYSSDLSRLVIKIKSSDRPVPESKVNFSSSTYPYAGYNTRFPRVTASYLNGEVNPTTNENIYSAIDNKVFYYTAPSNRFTFTGSPNRSDSIIIDLGVAKKINQVDLYLYEDNESVKAPQSYRVLYATEIAPDSFNDVPDIVRNPSVPAGNTINTAIFEWVDARKIKIVFDHNETSKTGIADIHVLGYKYPTYEAEDATLLFSKKISSRYASNAKYVKQTGHADSSIEFPNIYAPKSGYFTLNVRYANGTGIISYQKLIVNGNETSIAYPISAGREVFKNITQNIYLSRGNNSIKLLNSNIGSVEIDNISVMKMDSYKDDFIENRSITDARGWIPYSGGWSVSGGRYSVLKGNGLSVLSYKPNGNFTNYRNVMFSSKLMVKDSCGEAGLIFRGSNSGDGLNVFNGYYASIDKFSNSLVLKKSDGKNSIVLSSAPIIININTDYNLKIITLNNSIKVFFNNSKMPLIDITDETYHSGVVGLKVINSAAEFSNIFSCEIYGESNDVESLEMN